VSADEDTACAPPTDDPIGDLFRLHRLTLVRLAVFLTSDRGLADEIVQDAFVALHRHWDRLKNKGAAVGYLRTSVVNGARSAHRRRLVAWRHQRAAEPEAAPAADAGMLLQEEHRLVVQALRRLPRRQREVLVLRYWSELSEADIADTLGISRGTVKSTASRALRSLEKLLKDEQVGR